MKRAIILLAVFLSVTPAVAREIVDPFVNPILSRQKVLKAELERKRSLAGAPRSQEVNLFKPKINKPLSKLSIQGVIEENGKYILVLLDPETGQTFFLKEGDPIAPDEKIAKITLDRVVIYRFKKVKGKIVKEKITISVDTEC